MTTTLNRANRKIHANSVTKGPIKIDVVAESARLSALALKVYGEPLHPDSLKDLLAAYSATGKQFTALDLGEMAERAASFRAHLEFLPPVPGRMPKEGKCGKPVSIQSQQRNGCGKYEVQGGYFCCRLPGHDKPSKDAEGKLVAPTWCPTIPF